MKLSRKHPDSYQLQRSNRTAAWGRQSRHLTGLDPPLRHPHTRWISHFQPGTILVPCSKTPPNAPAALNVRSGVSSPG